VTLPSGYAPAGFGKSEKRKRAASGNPARQKAAVDFVLNGLDKGTLKPIIDKVFAFDQIVDAHRYLEAGGQIGKIVVTM